MKWKWSHSTYLIGTSSRTEECGECGRKVFLGQTCYYDRNTKETLHRDCQQVRYAAERAGEYEVQSTLTIEEWREIKLAHDRRCYLCGSDDQLSPDHVVPLIQGGTNTADNIRPACAPCNTGKGGKTLEDYLDELN